MKLAGSPLAQSHGGDDMGGGQPAWCGLGGGEGSAGARRSSHGPEPANGQMDQPCSAQSSILQYRRTGGQAYRRTASLLALLPQSTPTIVTLLVSIHRPSAQPGMAAPSRQALYPWRRRPIPQCCLLLAAGNSSQMLHVCPVSSSSCSCRSRAYPYASLAPYKRPGCSHEPPISPTQAHSCLSILVARFKRRTTCCVLADAAVASIPWPPLILSSQGPAYFTHPGRFAIRRHHY